MNSCWRFEFNNQLMPQSLVEIEELGHFGLEAWNDDGMYYYLVVKTFYGMSVVATCGPVVPDIPILPSGFEMRVDKVQYKEDKLTKTINYFLNDRAKHLTHAQVLPVEEAIGQFRELKTYMANLTEETF